MGLEWLELGDVEERVRRALKIPENQGVGVRHANFAKIKTQKFYVRFNSHDLVATFFADPRVARKESLILDHLNKLQSEALFVGFLAPKKLYFRNGLLIRECLEGEVMKLEGSTEKTLQKIAQLLLLFQHKPVRRDLQKYPLSFAAIRKEILNQLPQAEEAFTPFRGSNEAFERLAKVLRRDWSRRLRRQPKGFVHGDIQPQNILLQNGKIALIDFDRGGYFYSLFDAASFAVQFTHAALLEGYHRGEKPDRQEIRRRREVFLKEYRAGFRQTGAVWDEELFRLFKLLIIFNGLAFSTAGFRKKVTRGAKHLLFGLFRQELKPLAV